MYCEKCGAKIKDNAPYCGSCGAKQEQYDFVDETEMEGSEQEQNSHQEKDEQQNEEKTDNPEPTKKQKHGKEKSKGNKKLLIIICAAVLFCVCVGVVLLLCLGGNKGEKPVSTEKATETVTEALAEEKTGIPKTAAEEKASTQEAAAEEGGAVVSVGDYITFGTYEQNNNIDDGKEPIEWLVLDINGENALIISRYALDVRSYNTKNKIITWEESDLRNWLNYNFFNEAFSYFDQAIIQKTQNINDYNPKYGTASGNETLDVVFLLSASEAENYFTSREAAKCAATEYAIANGAYTIENKNVKKANKDDSDELYYIDGKPTCWWWLRTSGENQKKAIGISYLGDLDYNGDSVTCNYYCVRPAMWIRTDNIGIDAETIISKHTLNIGDTIQFSLNNNSTDYITYGFSQPEENFTWTDGSEASMLLYLEDADIATEMHAVFELNGVFNGKQNVTVLVNGQEVFTGDIFDGENLEFDFTVSDSKIENIVLRLPDCCSPSSLGTGSDDRNLGLMVKSFYLCEK